MNNKLLAILGTLLVLALIFFAPFGVFEFIFNPIFEIGEVKTFVKWAMGFCTLVGISMFFGFCTGVYKGILSKIK